LIELSRDESENVREYLLNNWNTPKGLNIKLSD
jgi:hypothetical protein